MHRASGTRRYRHSSSSLAYLKTESKTDKYPYATQRWARQTAVNSDTTMYRNPGTRWTLHRFKWIQSEPPSVSSFGLRDVDRECRYNSRCSTSTWQRASLVQSFSILRYHRHRLPHLLHHRRRRDDHVRRRSLHGVRDLLLRQSPRRRRRGDLIRDCWV